MWVLDEEQHDNREDKKGAGLHAPAVSWGPLHCLLQERIRSARVGEYWRPLESLLYGWKMVPITGEYNYYWQKQDEFYHDKIKIGHTADFKNLLYFII